jgi:methionyl-tRNA formyltransferase
VNIIFAGTPPFAATALAAIIEARHRVLLVLTQPDRPSGRGLKSQESAVKQLALEHQIPIYQPTSLKNQEAIDRLQLVNADVMVVAAYGLLLPESILRIPLLGCLNIHASLLPRWRGAAPIQRAILAGDQETGITIMQMDVGLDTGPMLMREKIQIDEKMNAQLLHDALAKIGAQLILKTLEEKPSSQHQTDEQVSYASKITKAEAKIKWTDSAITLDRLVRAFNPIPCAYTIWEGQPLKIWQASIDKRMNRAKPGTIVATDELGISVMTGDGILKIQELQRAGGKRLLAPTFLMGNPMAIGTSFES